MKQKQQALLGWADRLSIFASRYDSDETYEYRMQRAREQIEDIKHMYRGRTMVFDYSGETLRGEFLTAMEGDYPGVYMVVLKIASSRVCRGPCFLRVGGTRVGGIVVTGNDGIIGISARATALKRTHPGHVHPGPHIHPRRGSES